MSVRLIEYDSLLRLTISWEEGEEEGTNVSDDQRGEYKRKY
jgi:hypothetical protein